MKSSHATYEFFCGYGFESIEIESSDAITAFSQVKNRNQEDYFRIMKFMPGLPPEGFSLLEIGYGLSAAYRRTNQPEDSSQPEEPFS